MQDLPDRTERESGGERLDLASAEVGEAGVDSVPAGGFAVAYEMDHSQDPIIWTREERGDALRPSAAAG